MIQAYSIMKHLEHAKITRYCRMMDSLPVDLQEVMGYTPVTLDMPERDEAKFKA